jgi:CRP-like cAMP-binding protein
MKHSDETGTLLEMKAVGSPDGCFACNSKPGSIFCDLPAASLLELDQLRKHMSVPAGTTVFRQDDQPQAVYCIGSGHVKLSRNSEDGHALLLRIANAGDVLGVRSLLLGKPHDLTAEATEETRLCFISRNDFLEFLKRNGEVSLRLAEKLSTKLDDAYQQVYRAALKPPAERLAEVLLALCQTHGEPARDGIVLKTNMCQDELAELVGMSRRTLNRALGILKDQGLIECGRRYIFVRNPVALQAIA